MSVTSIILQYSALPPDSVKEWTPGALEDIDSSILFVLATWSGQSLAAFKKLTSRLANEPGGPELLVCDIDKLSPELTRQLGSLRGVGETFWISKGRVVARTIDYEHDDWSDSIDKNNNILRKD